MIVRPPASSSLAYPFLHNWIRGLVAVLLRVGLGACHSDGDGEGDNADAPPVIDVTAVDYAFAAPDTIPSGWVTFRMANEGSESHHFHLDRLPEGKTFADWQEAYKEPRDSLARLLRAGTIDTAEAGKACDRIVPDWAMLDTYGGVGLVAPGDTGQTTHHVDPGHYVMVCVIRVPGGPRHSSLGMVDEVVAVESSAERSPPTPDATVQAAGREIRMDDTLSSGRPTVGFRVEEVPENLQSGTDGYYSVWLARFDHTTDTSEVTAWDGQNPAPFTGLGGFEYLPPSDTAYVTVDVEPGRHAWIWFYDGMDLSADDAPLIEPFTVEDAKER